MRTPEGDHERPSKNPINILCFKVLKILYLHLFSFKFPIIVDYIIQKILYIYIYVTYYYG